MRMGWRGEGTGKRQGREKWTEGGVEREKEDSEFLGGAEGKRGQPAKD